MDEFDVIDPKMPGDRLIAEARARGDAYQEYPTENIAIQVSSYVDRQLRDEFIVDRSGAVVTIF